MSKMHLEAKLNILNRIYQVYADTMADADTACKHGCSRCCTRNVTLTTLEGYQIITRMLEQGQPDLIERIATRSAGRRFQPRLTINQMAAWCMEGRELPEEEAETEWGECPVLSDAACPIYPARPFGCRCMVSRRTCEAGGYADMDPFVLTVNTVFQQTIEHVDRTGCTGNFTDLLLCLSSGENRTRYREDALACKPCGLLPNRPLQALMVPPEHRERMAPVLAALRNIAV